MGDDALLLTRRELATGALLFAPLAAGRPAAANPAGDGSLALPAPVREGGPALTATLARRRSQRRFGTAPLTLAEVGQLLWSAQGVTSASGLRAAPSAGATYPLELDLVAARVAGLALGLHRYQPPTHTIARRDAADYAGGPRGRPDDALAAIARAAHSQSWIDGAAAVLVISAVTSRTATRYGVRAERYVAIEVGHAAQNVYLQATALELATVIVGAFDDDRVARLLHLAAAERPLALMPIGHH